MTWGWKCCPCDDCPCQCGSTICFQVEDVPTLAACGSNAAALTAMQDAFSGVLVNHTEGSCSWWRKVCADVGGGTINGYSCSLRKDSALCVMVLEFWQACDIPDIEDCCNPTSLPLTDPNITWDLLAKYTYDPEDHAGVFQCDAENLFVFQTDADGCATCADGGVDTIWPSTLTLAGATCDDSVPGGDECGGGADPCDCVDTLPTAPPLNYTFDSPCAAIDGQTGTLTFNTGPPKNWGGSFTLVGICQRDCANNEIGFALTLLCDAFALTFCPATGVLGCESFRFNYQISDCNGLGNPIVQSGNLCVVPASCSCAPVSLVFTGTLNWPDDHNNCGCGDNPTVTVTITD